VSGPLLAAGALQVGAAAIAPALPGAIQSLKARLQGRRGPTPLQPYRELRRLWRRSVVQPEGATALYGLVPALVVVALALCLLVVPLTGAGPTWFTGRDALVLMGLLALARFALAVSAWDTGGGFGLMGAGRDLTFAVAGEALLALVLLSAALPAGSTDLTAMWAGAAGTEAWTSPGHWCGAAGMALVLLLETGRQPVDNPDTHLELTMVHEGPLLEYAGRDLAMLQWAAAARHWVVLALAAGLYLPHPAGAWGGLGATALGMAGLAAALALTETWLAKMRLLRVPPVLAAGAGIVLLGLVSRLAGVAG
jgi:formate hydrogenlyase subunit 4